jgi:hypothetical protein
MAFYIVRPEKLEKTGFKLTELAHLCTYFLKLHQIHFCKKLEILWNNFLQLNFPNRCFCFSSSQLPFICESALRFKYTSIHALYRIHICTKSDFFRPDYIKVQRCTK